MIEALSKPRIRQVISTANLEQKINVKRLSKMPYGIYDIEIYGGRCGYIKTPKMDGRVTVFPSGKLISIGGKSVKNSSQQLLDAKSYLIQKKMIEDIKIKPIIQNIVATIETKGSLPIEKIAAKIASARYEPEIFPGIVLKGLRSCTFLLFASGKIVITGTKSLSELSKSSFELFERLNKFVR